MDSFLSWLADRLVILIPIVLCLSVHEWAHAACAYVLGDDTAKHMGRMTLNPIAHLDPLGMLLPLLGVPFGWAKPVPINPTRFDSKVSMQRGIMLTAAAGPVSNLCLAFICFCLLRGGFWLELGSAQGLNQFLVFMIGLNFALALFNLIPIAPLDGSLIVDSVISRNFRPTWEKLGAIGPALLLSAFLVLLYFNSELFDRLIPFD